MTSITSMCSSRDSFFASLPRTQASFPKAHSPTRGFADESLGRRHLLLLDALFAVLDTSDDDRAHIPTHFLSVWTCEREPLRSNCASAAIHREGSFHRDRVWHAQLVADQSRHLRIDDAGGRASRGAPSLRNALHERREHSEGDSGRSSSTHYDRARRRRHCSEAASLHHAAFEIRVFDPACGSGNFLVIAYKELRRLEHRGLAADRRARPLVSVAFQVLRDPISTASTASRSTTSHTRSRCWRYGSPSTR